MRVRQTFRRRSRKESRPGNRPHARTTQYPTNPKQPTRKQCPNRPYPLPADVRYFTPAGPFRLECGAAIPLRIAYHTYGTFTGDNALWVCHALTANSEVADWWPHGRSGQVPRPGALVHGLREHRRLVLRHHGTREPRPRHGKALLRRLPAGNRPRHGAGEPAVGGPPRHRARPRCDRQFDRRLQALEMALERPGFARKLILIATAARAQPWTIAADEAQRMALEADTTFGTDSPDAGRRGMEAARAIGLLTYRGSSAYNATQQEHDDPDKTRGFRACSYQRHQGEKLSRRFDAYSYRRITEAFDSHNVGRGRGGVERALGTIGADTLVVGITSDIILPVGEQLASGGTSRTAAWN
ncbi:MAG: homoserine O-acetyltransferase [Alistipes indistinctus]